MIAKTNQHASDLEIFLDRHYMEYVFCGWYKNACQEEHNEQAWGIASIKALSFLELGGAHDDIIFAITNIEILHDEN